MTAEEPSRAVREACKRRAGGRESNFAELLGLILNRRFDLYLRDLTSG